MHHRLSQKGDLDSLNFLILHLEISSGVKVQGFNCMSFWPTEILMASKEC